MIKCGEKMAHKIFITFGLLILMAQLYEISIFFIIFFFLKEIEKKFFRQLFTKSLKDEAKLLFALLDKLVNLVKYDHE